jgi:hypothetical protein
MKFINLDILISISDKGFLKIITIGKQKILVNCQIENVQKNTEILTCLTTQDKKKYITFLNKEFIVLILIIQKEIIINLKVNQLLNSMI